MRIVLFLVLLGISAVASATDYFVKNGGNDQSDGLSDATAWATIDKVNVSFTGLRPGDRILFKRGCTFYGSVNVTKSGSSGNPITIGAYGTGTAPVITGFTRLTSWNDEGNGIYSSAITSSIPTNMVSVDDKPVAMGRYPDSGINLKFEAHSGNTSITDNELGASVDWTGAEAVINANDWSLDRCYITSHTGNVLTYNNLGSREEPENNRYYFIQNHIKTLNVNDEWYHDASAGKFFIYGNPGSKSIMVATVEYLIFNNGFDYITIDGIDLRGATLFGVYMQTGTTYCTIRNCIIDCVGESGIRCDGGSYHTYDNNKISNINRGGIYINASGYFTITNNTINNIGVIPGGSFRGSQNDGMYLYGLSNSTVQYNEIYFTAYNGIYVIGNTIEIKNNFINYACMVLNDGGGIYTSGSGFVGRVFNNNIVINSGVGNPNATLAEGIYMDTQSAHITVSGNTTANCLFAGIKNHRAFDNTISGNTSFNNRAGIFLQNSTTIANTVNNVRINNNKVVAKNPEQRALIFYSGANDLSSFGSADNNYYARPVDDDDVFGLTSPSINSNYTLNGWQTITNQDLNSRKSPLALTDTADIDFFYNATKSDRTIALARPMIDVAGEKYAGSVILPPYTSVVLFPDPNPTQPATPVLSGAIIDNSAPALLTMSFSITLASIVPSATAFSIKVNGENRTVNAVAVSGNKVNLTLVSPVVFGDIITIAYTKPASNPLQTTSGGQVATFPVQNVTNGVGAAIPLYVSSVIENSTPARLEMTYNLTLSNIIPSASAFVVLVNSSVRSVSSIAISGTKVQLSLSSPVTYGDVVTVAYTKPSSNPLQTTQGSQASSFSAQSVVNNCAAPLNQPPTVTISSPVKGSSYSAPATIIVEVSASDPDGTISKVELFNGSNKLDERTTTPYSFTIKNLEEGQYSIHAEATDNLKSVTTSPVLEIQVIASLSNENSEFFNLYPNPNDGLFSIDFSTSLESDNLIVSIVSFSGTKVYQEKILKEETTKQFDLSDLNPGTYILMITGDKILLTHKFVKN